ncbi:c-type cytochrome [Variovorax sp. PvP013_2]
MTRHAGPSAWLPIGSLLQLSIAAMLLLAAWAAVPTQTRPIADAALPPEGTPELARLVHAGRRLAMADCVACHSADGGRPFAGGVALDTALGTIYSTNISPDPQAGIGRYTLDDFDRAVRHGIARDGQTLRQAMPYPRYARLSDADTKALYAFFMHGVEAAPDVNRPADVAWPLSMRWPLAIWRKTCAVSRSDGAP